MYVILYQALSITFGDFVVTIMLEKGMHIRSTSLIPRDTAELQNKI
jgi:hypothetical protein